MKQRLIHGSELEFATPAEIASMLAKTGGKGDQISSVRASTTVVLVNGTGLLEVYKVPLGYDFYVRRVTISISTVADPASGLVLATAANEFIAYQRSGALIQYGLPKGPNAVSNTGGAVQIPGVETWGDQQGPYLRNGEVFEVYANLTGFNPAAGASVEATVQGILKRPAHEVPPSE